MARAQISAATHSRTGPLVGDWTGMVVYVGDTVWDGNQFVSQHVAGRLANRTPVLYVDPPLSVVSTWRNPALAPSLRGPRLRLIRPGLARLTTVVPPGLSRPIMRDVATSLLRQKIRRTVAAIGVRPSAMIVGSLLPVLGAVGADKQIYYATDDLAAGASLMGYDAPWVRRQIDRQIAAADTVITVSEHFATKCQKAGLNSVFVPNGCDIGMFARTDDASWPSDVTLAGPIAGFVGHLSARIDLGYLEAIADRGISLLLVGPRQLTFNKARIDPLLARPNVQWVGSKPFADLPSYLKAIDVGLVPYADTEFNRASFPLKTLEYLAAGRGVVSTDLPSAHWLSTDLVGIASTPNEFAAEVERQLAMPRTSAQITQRQTFAELHSWDRRTDQIAGLLGLAP